MIALPAAIPVRLIAMAIAAAALFGAGFMAGKRWVQAAWHAESADRAAQALAASEEARRIEQHRVREQSEIVHAATKQVDQARADARAAATAADRLREHAEQLAGQCAGGSAAAAGGTPASSPGALLAELQRRLDAAAGELARYADDARIAGAACERAYDSLTSGTSAAALQPAGGGVSP